MENQGGGLNDNPPYKHRVVVNVRPCYYRLIIVFVFKSFVDFVL
jgi:hypothetical protein